MCGDRPDDAAPEPAGKTPRFVQKLKIGLRAQSLISLALAALLIAVGPVAAISSLLGSLAVYLPGLMFTVLTVRKLGGDTAAFLRTATLAEVGKLLLTGALCAAVFIYVRPLAPGFFFLGFIVTLAVGWAALVWAFSRHEHRL